MKRSYQKPSYCRSGGLADIRLKTAIHEAGHAAAIYLGNKQKQLPPVFFHIVVSGLSNPAAASRSCQQCFARVEGGRLIHTLPSSLEEVARDFSPTQKQAYLQAFDADMVNLLIGPLAEANYIAMMDDEIINHRLINLSALPHYGGAADLQMIEAYLACMVGDEDAEGQKVAELFAAAFDFINGRDNWRAIIGLANAILMNKGDVMGCEEIIAVLNTHFYAARKVA